MLRLVNFLPKGEKMKKLLCVTLLASSCVFGADGAAMFKACAACHGAKAEKPYLGGKVPALNTLDAAARLEDLKAYKAGTLNGGKGKAGQGGIMKAQLSKYSEEDLAVINDYISTLK